MALEADALEALAPPTATTAAAVAAKAAQRLPRNLRRSPTSLRLATYLRIRGWSLSWCAHPGL